MCCRRQAIAVQSAVQGYRRTKVYDDDVLYFADLRRHGAGDGIEREVQPRQVVQVADSRPISHGARQIIVAQIQRSDPAKVAVGAIAPVVARIDAPHPTPMRLMIARIRGTVHVPPVIVQPVGTAEQLEERDEGGPIRSSHRHGSKPQSHLRQSSTERWHLRPPQPGARSAPEE